MLDDTDGITFARRCVMHVECASSAIAHAVRSMLDRVDDDTLTNRRVLDASTAYEREWAFWNEFDGDDESHTKLKVWRSKQQLKRSQRRRAWKAKLMASERRSTRAPGGE